MKNSASCVLKVIAVSNESNSTVATPHQSWKWVSWPNMAIIENRVWISTVYPKKYAHGFIVLCFVVVMQSFIMNSHEVFIHIHQGCFAGTGAIVRLPQCQWSKPDGYGKISHCITTTKHSKAKTVCIFLAIYCNCVLIKWRAAKIHHHMITHICLKFNGGYIAFKFRQLWMILSDRQ